MVRNNRLLWTIQGLLAALFLFAGGFKLVIPAEELAAQAQGMPIGFLRFIGAMEVLGAIGLLLPGLVGIQQWLTPLAAAGLVVIMIGAVGITLMPPSAGRNPSRQQFFSPRVSIQPLLVRLSTRRRKQCERRTRCFG